MDIKKELSEIISNMDTTMVTEDESREIFQTVCQLNAVKERIRELEKTYMDLSVKQSEWWNKMYEKYGLDCSLPYQFLSATRTIIRRNGNA